MLEQILYDKVISVTLYRKVRDADALYKTLAPSSFSESKVNGKRVLRSEAQFLDKIVTNSPKQTSAPSEEIGSHYTQTGAIEFYQGLYRQVLVDIVQVRGQYVEKYKRIRAAGSLYTFATLDDMKRGVRPDGSPFQTGDRIRVTEDKSLWNVYVEGTVSGAYTETIVQLPTQVLEINCTDSGLKPDMSLSINLLPGQNCYGATLKIKNFNLDAIDIRNWDRMVITAGYRTGPKVVYNCPIFSSYMESPNPDGVTVFEGLTVGIAEDILTDRYIIVKFVQEEMTLERLIRDVAKGISPNITVVIALGDEYTRQKLIITKQEVYAQNGMAVLNWLQEFVSSIVYEMSGGVTTVLTQLIDGKLSVIAINGKNKSPAIYDNIVNLDMVTGATFAGTALTVVAPWNPSLRPGDLFFMPPQFINGAKLPNNINLSDYRNEENLYRAITMSVEFATTDSTNKMSILAVPAQWAGRLPSDKTTEMPADMYGELLSEQLQKSETSVQVGDLNSTEVKDSYKAKQKEDTGNKFFDEHKNILTQWSAWTSITQRASIGTTISQVATFYLYDMAGGPQLVSGMGNNRQRNYQETVKWLTDQNRSLALRYYQNTGISAQYLWWPLITLGTYYRRQMDIKSGVNNNWSLIYPNNPDFIEEGKSLYVPVFPNGSWESNRSLLSSIKDIWKDAYKAYGGIKTTYIDPVTKEKKEKKSRYGDSARIWRAMYYYLGGVEDLPDNPGA